MCFHSKGGLTVSGRIKRLCACFALLLAFCAALPARAEEQVVLPTLAPDALPYDKEHPENLSPDQLYAWAAILIEADSGKVIFEKNPDDIRYPASTTKIMTALLTLTLLDDEELDQKVTCSAEAIAVTTSETDVTSLKLQEGEEVVLRDLLWATLIYSANDGANVIAEAVGGTIDNFVDMMNDLAERLGCTNTHFHNAHGLHDDAHYTTARDLAIITQAAMQYEEFRKIVSTQSYVFPATNKRKASTLRTTNELFNPGTDEKPFRYYYPDIIGVKTGFTSKAQYCFVGAAERDGVTLISVVMYAGDNSRWADTIKLLDYGFSQYVSVSPADLYARAPITLSTSTYALDDGNLGRVTLNCVPADAISRNKRIIATKDEVEAMAANFLEIALIDYTRDFAAPVTAGEKMGTITWLFEDGTIGTYDLVATRTVNRRSNAPKTLAQIEQETASDPNPFPRWSLPVLFEVALPLLIAALILYAIVRWAFGRRKPRRSRDPQVTHRYLR